MNSINQDLRQKVHEKYQDILHLLLESQKDLESMDSKNSDVKKYLTIFKDIFNYSIENAKKRIEDVDKRMIWERLVIAFFGETNAGKSTIIETLRIKYEKNKKSEDGSIVGTGKTDFTQTFDEYDIDMNGIPITIIDMPGIEGDEPIYKDKIRDALDKAHIILYVARRQPDIKQIEKIKSYLNDWVKVYSIYNISSFFITPEEDLCTKHNNEMAHKIENTFMEALSSTYKGNISVHCLAALCAVAKFSPSREDLILNQNKFIKSFITESALYDFSKMPAIEEFLKDVGNNYINEIVEANKTRLVALTKQTAETILNASRQQEGLSKNIPKELRKFKNDINRYFNDCSEDIDLSGKYIIKYELRCLRDYIYELIDSKDKELKSKGENKSNQCMKSISTKIEKSIKQSLKDLNNKIKKRKDKLNVKISQINLEEHRFENSNDFDFSLVNSFLGVLNWDKILDWGIDITKFAAIGAPIGAPIGGIIGAAIGAAIGAIVGGIKRWWQTSRGVYREIAKQSINKGLQEAQNSLIHEFEKNTRDLLWNLSDKCYHMLTKVDNEINYINAAQKDIKATCIKLEKLEHKITTSEYGKI